MSEIILKKFFMISDALLGYVEYKVRIYEMKYMVD